MKLKLYTNQGHFSGDKKFTYSVHVEYVLLKKKEINKTIYFWIENVAESV